MVVCIEPVAEQYEKQLSGRLQAPTSAVDAQIVFSGAIEDSRVRRLSVQVMCCSSVLLYTVSLHLAAATRGPAQSR